MGNQVNFFMVPEDEEEFCKFVLRDPAVKILRAFHLDDPHVPVSPPLAPSDQPYCAGLVLWNADVASRELVTPRAKVPDAACGKGRYDVNAIVHPVIEFDRSVARANGLSPGRIWAGFDFHEDRLTKEQMKLFRSWFRRLARWLNKWPYRWEFYRMGPKTKEYLDKGGTFVSFVPGDVVSIKETGTNRVIQRSVDELSFRPEVERKEGESG
ncbi:MAG: hypothetical protein AMXMBFR13_43430 [Phycisphaerae bacterium]